MAAASRQTNDKHRVKYNLGGGNRLIVGFTLQSAPVLRLARAFDLDTDIEPQNAMHSLISLID